MEGKLLHYVARDGERISELFDTPAEAIAFVHPRFQGPNMAFNMAVHGLSFGIRPAVNTWGTENAEEIAYIENARYDAVAVRQRSRERFERARSLGVSAEDAETYVEFGGK